MGAEARWTIMIYMAGDNDLSAAGERDLAEMRRVGSTDQVHVLVELDAAGGAGTRRLRVGRDGAGEEALDLGETDSGSPEQLADFVAWGAERFPAERHALILWNHGGGWEPTEVERIAREVRSPGFTPGEGAERSGSPVGRALFRTTLARILSLPTPAERAICSDDGSGHSLDMIELARVLAGATRRIGRPLDLLGMDACLMSNLEVAYQVRPYARHLVASEELEPNQGWPYEALLASLAARPEQAADEVAAGIVAAYLAYYDGIDHVGDLTQTALRLERLGDVTAPLDALADALRAELPAAAGGVWAAQRASARFQANTLWDIAHFCEALEGAGFGPAVLAAAADVRAALAPGAGRLVHAHGTRGERVRRCGGLSVYLLPQLLELSRYYAEVDFARDHRWLAMLEAYHAA